MCQHLTKAAVVNGEMRVARLTIVNMPAVWEPDAMLAAQRWPGGHLMRQVNQQAERVNFNRATDRHQFNVTKANLGRSRKAP